MYVRSYTWCKANISWSVVVEELLYSMEKSGHNVTLLSTNGYDGMQRWNNKKALRDELKHRKALNGKGYDLDITYTVPQNFPQRFLQDSKKRMAIFAYESSIMPGHWKKYYNTIDYVLPPSQYVAEMIEKNGCPRKKIKVVPHGVDLDVFNPSVSPLPIESSKKFKFLCIGEPHYRKQIDKLLTDFCEVFSAKDDVCLVLKTKLFSKTSEKKGFEIDLRKTLVQLVKKHGSNMPEIKLVTKRIDNIASLYAACDAFCLMTASEGWGMPFLEALSMGMPVIAPDHGGQLEFLNKDNSFLTKCGIRKALPQEQYWQQSNGAVVGNPDRKSFSDTMRWVFENSSEAKERVRDNALKTASKFTWKNAADMILGLASDS